MTLPEAINIIETELELTKRGFEFNLERRYWSDDYLEFAILRSRLSEDIFYLHLANIELIHEHMLVIPIIPNKMKQIIELIYPELLN